LVQSQGRTSAIKDCEPVKVNQIGFKPPKEPWFYGYIEFVGWLNQLLSILLLVLGVLTLVLGAAGPFTTAESGFSLLASSAGLYFVSAIQLIGVDVARNVRAARYHLH
jgi:hypothetical protein